MRDILKCPQPPGPAPKCPKCGRPMEYSEPPYAGYASWGCAGCWLTPIPARYFDEQGQPVTRVQSHE